MAEIGPLLAVDRDNGGENDHLPGGCDPPERTEIMTEKRDRLHGNRKCVGCGLRVGTENGGDIRRSPQDEEPRCADCHLHMCQVASGLAQTAGAGPRATGAAILEAKIEAIEAYLVSVRQDPTIDLGYEIANVMWGQRGHQSIVWVSIGEDGQLTVTGKSQSEVNASQLAGALAAGRAA